MQASKMLPEKDRQKHDLAVAARSAHIEELCGIKFHQLGAKYWTNASEAS